MAKERRAQPRRPVRLEVVIDNERRFSSASTLEVSHRGALLESSEGAEVGDRVRLIPLIETDARVLDLEGTVLRVSQRPATGRYRMALALHLDSHGVDAVDEICSIA